MTEIDKLINIANTEVGYLEKSWSAYNANPEVIYDKTAGAGNDNVTKYAKEMDDLEVYNGPKQGYAWCKVFVDWCMVQAFGLDRAEQLLYGWTAGVTQCYNWNSLINSKYNRMISCSYYKLRLANDSLLYIRTIAIRNNFYSSIIELFCYHSK